MAIKFYVESHIDKAVTTQLRRQGVDIIRAQDMGMKDADDPDHLEYATAEGRAVVTNDRDFAELNNSWLAQGRNHAGIFLITRDKENIGMIVRTLLFWHEAVEGEAATLENDVYNKVNYLP
jgi:predicted nuclease of predicted toxin-antitoxin system